MKRKILFACVLAAIAANGVFAQTDFASMPKNTLTVDLGPTIVGGAMALLGSTAFESGDGLSTSGFGIGAQYERQLSRHFSVAGRFAYLKFGLGFKEEGEGAQGVLNIGPSSFSAEAHVRYYPFGQTFFVDAMGGYGQVSINFSGDFSYTDENGSRQRESVSITGTRHYIKYGGKLGWRIDFGRPRGFVFEPSLGFYGQVGLGDSLWKNFEGSLVAEGGEAVDDSGGLEDALALMEQFVFMGGPRVSLAFGWRF